ncbi:MAG TPA: methyltransferase type 11 [Actinobacteria bacterium]|nr:methyltransferase type 11 [Actinomycetota bacterium]
MTNNSMSVSGWLRWDMIARVLRDSHPSRVLEVGCGRGAMGARIAVRVTDYLGCEPDAESFAVARIRIEAAGGRVLQATFDELPPDLLFDLVCSFEVLEHLEDDAGALAAWCGRLRPGGRVLVSVPAGRDHFGDCDAMVGHFRRYDPQDLVNLMRAAGLTNISVVTYGWPVGRILELVRQRAARAARVTAGGSTAERTAASGRLLQPSGWFAGLATATLAFPFRFVQRLAPGRGTGLIGTGIVGA